MKCARQFNNMPKNISLQFLQILFLPILHILQILRIKNLLAPTGALIGSDRSSYSDSVLVEIKHQPYVCGRKCVNLSIIF